MIKIMNHELAKTLTTALVQFIDRERPEGTTCCSSFDCENIRAAFEEGEYDCVEALIKKKLLGLTEFELFLFNSVLDNNFVGVKGSSNALEMTKKIAPKLLALAKKELLSYADESNPAIEAMADLERTFSCNPDKLPIWLKEELDKAFKKGQEASHEDYIKGYANGYKDAEKRHNESVAYHFPSMPVTPSGYGCDGTYCINPQMDCINCPRRTDGGMFNTQSGTSTAKAEG